MKSHFRSAPLLAALLLALVLWLPAAFSGSRIPAVTAATGLEDETRRGEELVRTLHVAELLGPLAPVALSPFFALTCLSGASLLADSGMLPDAVAKNPFLGANSVLNNGFVFFGLLTLTLLTTAPKLTKVTKPLAQAIDQIEAHAGIIAVVAVQLLSQVHLGDNDSAGAAPVIYQAGVISFSATTLLAVFSAINIFVVNTVKFFFEVLVFLSPFPAVDAAFEAANKAFAAFLLGVYLFSPWVATALNLSIFLLCLLIFAWVYRRVIYMRSVLGDPILGWIAESVFQRPKVTLVSTPLPPSIARQFPEHSLALKAFAGRAYGGLKRKTHGHLINANGRLHFATTRLLRAPLIVTLPSEGQVASVETGLLAHTIAIRDDAGEITARFLITRRYNSLLESIRSIVSSGPRPSGAQPLAAKSNLLVGRSAAQAVRGEGRATLRAELA